MNKYWSSKKLDEESNEDFNLQGFNKQVYVLDTPKNSIENTVYFYSDVTSSSCCELNRTLREIDSKLQQVKVTLNTTEFVPVIHLRISSFGGDVFAAMSVVDTIRNLKTKIYSYVEGSAASAATMISIAANKRFIGKNSLMLIHQLSSMASGTFEQLEDEQTNNRRLMVIIKNLYRQYTKIPMKELETILKRDLWLESDICLKHGLVDEII